MYKYTICNNDRNPISFEGQSFVIPSFVEIKETIFNQLRASGFSHINFVHPSKANCIVRIFKSLNYKYEDVFYDIYGAHCFTRKSGKWISMSKGGEFEIDFSKFEIRHWLFQDEYIDFNIDFFDCYLKIK